MKVVDTGNGLDPGEPAAGDDKIKQRLADVRAALEIGFLKV